MFAFLNQYTHTLDDKSRLTIPADYRQAFLDGLVITCAQEPHLVLFTLPGWEALTQRFDGKPVFTDPRLADLRRLIFSNAVPMTLDGHGRIRIPDRLRTHAQIEGQAVLAGVGDHVEVWSPSLWQEKQEQLKTFPLSDAQEEMLRI